MIAYLEHRGEHIVELTTRVVLLAHIGAHVVVEAPLLKRIDQEEH